MTSKPRRRMFRLGRRRFLRRVFILRRCLRFLWNRILTCTLGKSALYRQLPRIAMSSPSLVAVESGFGSGDTGSRCFDQGRDSGDLVALKICLLGDCRIGKTSFLTKYVGREREEHGFQMTGLNRMDKTLCVRGARIAYSIWEVGGTIDHDLLFIDLVIAIK
ncbi:hypothetical protein CsSME_00027058 [Camellia sinensis var. sinensis]